MLTREDEYDPTADSFKSYSFALTAIREALVRSGELEPVNDWERRQAAEGPRDWRNFDCVREVRA